MKYFMIAFLCVFFPSKLLASSALVCSDAKQKLRYEYFLEEEDLAPWIQVAYEKKVYFKKLPFIGEALVDDASFSLVVTSSKKLKFRLEEKRFGEDAGYTSLISEYLAKFTLKNRETGNVIFDSYVICESSKLFKTLLTK